MSASSRADLRFGSIPNMVRVNADRFGDRLALSEPDGTMTYAQLAGHMVAATRAFMAAGIGPGDRVAVIAPNSSRWITAALGLLGAGAWVVPVNTRFKGPEIASVLERSNVSMICAVTDFLGLNYLELIAAAAPQLRALRHAVVLDGPLPQGAMAYESFIASGAGIAPSEAATRISAVGPDDVADVLFTSGTTSRPKGVLLRHGATMRGFDDWNTIGWHLGPGDRQVVVPPFFHTFGYKQGWMLGFMVGATVYPVRVFDALQLLELIQRERITHLPGPPTIFAAMLDHPERSRFDLSSLRKVLVSATTVPIELVRRLQLEWHVVVTTAYGLTEASSVVSITRADDPPEVPASSVGWPIPDIELQVVDDLGRRLAPGNRGELLIRGYTIMKGYLDDPDATAATIDPEGWLHTGDIGVIDSDGLIHITDRKKDMYICGGFNVSPAEVENALLGHRAIAAAAVIGVPDARMGEVGAAVVVARRGAHLDVEELRAWCRTIMANYKVPKLIEVADSLPTNSSGKVLKHELRRTLLTRSP
jgi:acyl-CoA synthetase (AMP-forming)/AMP-acid ligase II